MKIILQIIIYCCLYSCSTSHLKFIRATSQKWANEQKNLSGINYHFVLKTNCDTNTLKVQSLCIENKSFTDFNLSVLGKSNTCKNYIKGDSILLSINITDNKIINENPSIYDKKKNIYISYLYKNKLHNIIIDTVQTLLSLY